MQLQRAARLNSKSKAGCSVSSYHSMIQIGMERSDWAQAMYITARVDPEIQDEELILSVNVH